MPAWRHEFCSSRRRSVCKFPIHDGRSRRSPSLAEHLQQHQTTAALKALRRITIPPRFRAVSYVLITRIDYKATVSELDALQVTLARSDLEVAWQGNEKEVAMSRLHKLRAAAAAAEQNGMAMRRCVSPFISSRRPL